MQLRSVYSISLVLILFLTGCTGGMKTRWRNFNAHYNTFYNANTSFKKGFKAFREQKPIINAERPIRIFVPPNQVGKADFEKAVEKGAKILREYPTTKWVDNSLFIMGKSYFFLTQYFAAEQKFDELEVIALEDRLKQEALFWKARVMLETGRVDEDIRFLTAEINRLDRQLDDDIRADMQLVLAELYVKTKNYQAAIDQINPALGEIRDKKHRVRAAFLLGQLYERLFRPLQAIDAYSIVASSNVDYTLIFESNRKIAEMTRAQGDYERALSIYNSMVRDDKNFDIISDLLYEVGRTQQLMNNPESARQSYERVLRNDIKKPSNLTQAKTYYGLGEIARDYALNFSLAAQYFDSSATKATDRNQLSEDFDADKLAIAFGDYSRIRSDIARMDSLLWLSSLSKPELDSVINIARERLIEEARKRQKEQDAASNTFATGISSESNEVISQGQFGFLNYQNAELVSRSKSAFIGRWGVRPLVDNWRLMEAILNNPNAIDESKRLAEQGAETGDIGVFNVRVDLSEIPFQGDQQREMRNQMAKRKYELGNVFYLNLNMVDSARVIFENLIQEHPNAESESKALYNLVEIYAAMDYENRVNRFANLLIQKYPADPLARRVTDMLNLDASGLAEQKPSASDSLRHAFTQIADSISTLSPLEAGQVWKGFAARSDTNEYRAFALWFGADEFMESAKQDPLYKVIFEERETLKKDIGHQKAFFTMLKDSAASVLQTDSLLTASDSTYWQGIIDSTYVPPDLPDPYQGFVWDTTRVMLQDLTVNHPTFTHNESVRIILSEIGRFQPEVKQDTVSILMPTDVTDLGTFTGDRQQVIKQIESDLAEKIMAVEPIFFEVEMILGVDGKVKEIKAVGESAQMSEAPILLEAIKTNWIERPSKRDGVLVQVRKQERFIFFDSGAQ